MLKNKKIIDNIKKISNYNRDQISFNELICKLINYELLNSTIKVRNKNIFIRPVWVESYYEQLVGKKYKCGAMHGFQEQMNPISSDKIRFYFHRKGRYKKEKKGGMNGVDLVLSNKELALSILLKASFVSDNKNFKNKSFKTETELYCFIKKYFKQQQLIYKEGKSIYEVYADILDGGFKNLKQFIEKRVGVLGVKPKYNELASYSLDKKISVRSQAKKSKAKTLPQDYIYRGKNKFQCQINKLLK